MHDHRVWFYYRKQKQQSTTFFEQKSTDLDPIPDDYFGSFLRTLWPRLQ